ncbi:molybdopterin-binding protein [Desulfovibrio sp. X2]|uniref:molybdopterin-binding protein n=1 Tax=Desulfovibrio sp. X2 TaxID=941449 RepID=UPI000551082D|nr:molybdopterin-binding protein [Desulfovibrio sp. X2]
MTAIPVQDAVGTVLCHDITRIVPGESKGAAFRKGHVITGDDVEALLKLGKEHIYVFAPGQGLVHEDDAAMRIARAAVGQGLRFSAPCEGRVNMIADVHGLLSVNVDALRRINSIDEMAFASLHTRQEVEPGRPVAGARVIPLMVEEDKMRQVEALCAAAGPVIQVKPFRSLRVGMVTTGSEVYHGRIKDKFGPVLKRKFEHLGSRILRQIIVSDDVAMTVSAIHQLLVEGAQMIVVTGGMSVDPDDQTPTSIREAGGKLTAYGAPVLPGAMFLLAHIGTVPVLGLPGCVMYHKASIFDLVVPRLLAGEEVTREDLAGLGHGGFCAACPECRYPVCPFGKGS